MKRITARTGIILILLFGTICGCKEDPPASLFEPAGGSGPAPTITSINPPALALAGVSEVTITGTNFSSVPGNNQVMFDATPGTVLQASTTQLKVRAPLLVKDIVQVKVSVQGTALFSNIFMYKLLAAVAEFGTTPNVLEDCYGIACDTAGTLYASLVLTANNGSEGVRRFAKDTIGTPFSTTAGVTQWSGLKVGPGGVLYAARNLSVMYKIPAAGGPGVVWVSAGLGIVADFDFDQNGNVWAAGNGVGIYRITPAGQVKRFNFTARSRTVRVFNNYVYVGAKIDSLESVWRFPIISSDSLGVAEKYFDFSARYVPNGPGVYAITFNSDGDLYIGTDAPEGIILVHPDKTAEPLYPGLIGPQSNTFAWGKGSDLFVARLGGFGIVHRIIRINTLKQSAPYYGRQ